MENPGKKMVNETENFGCFLFNFVAFVSFCLISFRFVDFVSFRRFRFVSFRFVDFVSFRFVSSNTQSLLK